MTNRTKLTVYVTTQSLSPRLHSSTHWKLGAILNQGGLELLQGAVFPGERDDELSQVLVIDPQVVLQLCTDLGDQRKLLQLLKVLHKHLLVKGTHSESVKVDVGSTSWIVEFTFKFFTLPASLTLN